MNLYEEKIEVEFTLNKGNIIPKIIFNEWYVHLKESLKHL